MKSEDHKWLKCSTYWMALDHLPHVYFGGENNYLMMGGKWCSYWSKLKVGIVYLVVFCIGMQSFGMDAIIVVAQDVVVVLDEMVSLWEVIQHPSMYWTIC